MYNKKVNIPKLTYIFMIIMGICVMLYPITIGYVNSNKEHQTISTYTSDLKSITEAKYVDMLKEAEKYNQSLTDSDILDAFSSDNDTFIKKEYIDLLNINDNDVMGYIKIPKIDVSLPIYHGTSSKVLQKGVGHLENSSLPIGGEGTHAILSSHRGLPSSKLFSDLNQLAEGDMFYIHILDQILAYKVDQVMIVEPSNVENLKITEGEDYVTLVTCTPYAINTHRLLVRGSRVEYNEEILNNIVVEHKISTSDVILFIGLFIGIIIIVISSLIIKRIDARIKSRKTIIIDGEVVELPKKK